MRWALAAVAVALAGAIWYLARAPRARVLSAEQARAVALVGRRSNLLAELP